MKFDLSTKNLSSIATIKHIGFTYIPNGVRYKIMVNAEIVMSSGFVYQFGYPCTCDAQALKIIERLQACKLELQKRKMDEIEAELKRKLAKIESE